MASLYERPAIAALLGSQGNPGAAARAMFAPDTLGPSQLKTPQDALFGDSKKEKDLADKLVGAITDTVTNPVFVLGMMLSMKFPIASADSLFKMRKGVADWKNRLAPLMRQISSLPTQFGGAKEIPKLMEDLALETAAWKAKYGAKMTLALEKFQKVTGRGPNASEQRRIAMYLDGLHINGGNEVQAAFRLERPLINAKLPAWMNDSRNKHIKKFADEVKGMFNEAWMDLYGWDNGSTMKEALRRKGWTKGVPTTVTEMENLLKRHNLDVGSGNKTFDAVADKLHGLGIGVRRTKGQRMAIAKELEAQGWLTDVDRIGNYFPHQTKFTKNDYDKFIKGTINRADGREKLFGDMAAADATSRMSTSFKERTGIMMPDPFDLQAEKEFVDLEMLSKMEARAAKTAGGMLHEASRLAPKPTAKMIREGTVPEPYTIQQRIDNAKDFLANKLKMHPQAVKDQMPYLEDAIRGAREDELYTSLQEMTSQYGPGSATKKYSLQLTPVFDRYVHSTGNMKAWTLEGYGPRIVGATNKLDEIGKDMMRNTYIPMAMGRQTFSQSVQSVEWANTRDKWYTALDKGTGMVKYLPGNMREWMKKAIVSHQGPMSLGGFSGRIAGYFYTSALGLNPASALKNTLQTWLTTAPLVGVKHTANGMAAASKGVKEYTRLRFNGTAVDVAFQKAFPDFVKAGLDPSPLSEGLFKGALEDAWVTTRGTTLAGGSGGVKAALGHMQDKMMSMFTASERWNRVVTFHAAKSKAMADMGTRVANFVGKGETFSKADQFARAVVEHTQFPAGPGQTPYVLRNLPAPLRQFLHFPLRFGEFLGASTLRQNFGRNPVTGAVDVPIPGIPLGVLGRVGAASTAIYAAGKNMADVDLSSGLIWGALPLPQGEGSPFHPFPVVPPVIGIAGAGVQALHSGSVDPLKRVAPLLVPGGIALNRARNFLSPEFAGYNERTPDGKIPLYSKSGALTGNFSGMQLVGRSIGMGSMTATKERELMGYLLAQRDSIRTIRREYMEALSEGDITGAEEVQEEFKKRFPGLGKITVKSQDMQAIQLRRRVTRLERVLDTLPAQYRHQYGELVSTTLGMEAQSLLGVDPTLLEKPRMSFRNRPRTRNTNQRSSSARLNTSSVGLQQLPQLPSF